MILNGFQEINSVYELSLGYQEDLISETRWQGLYELLVLVLRDECVHIALNVLLDLLRGVKGDLGLASQL